MGGGAQNLHGPGLELRHEKDGHAPQEHGIDVQEVTRKDAGGLSARNAE